MPKGKENARQGGSKRRRVAVDSDSELEDARLPGKKRIDHAVTSMTQLVNQMSLDKMRVATAQCRTAEAEQRRAEAEQRRVEAERASEEARLARVSKEAELLEINRAYTQKVLETLALAKELGFDANDLRLFKDPLAFIESKRPSNDSTLSTPARPRPDVALPSPAPTPSHPPAQPQYDPSAAQPTYHQAPHPHLIQPQYHYHNQPPHAIHYNQPLPPQFQHQNSFQIQHATHPSYPPQPQANQSNLPAANYYRPLQEISLNRMQESRPDGQPSINSYVPAPVARPSHTDIQMMNTL
ncbi:uncharacterized protein EV420DRAFT_589673 [Desarmillaria tabescens]|uniref:No apical meristem-associated C-terminal domain-containing protein n=1 Tax=Armillaria tabescens TaxID=1929756 RepID=A0AA39N2R6_ARMTA|nr:uncharacterized protein EV420DRAFT_589673 [Desarmillaria tabescens]KAK0455239.1 hypothetical protein EV420DRAFT_589673 [Desarmillaria tabescens]